MPGRQRRRPPSSAPAADRLRQHATGCPIRSCGTTPSYLAVRDWEDMAEGDMFTDRDVRNGNKVCVIGTTIKRELFQGESPVGKEIRIHNVSFRVIGVLSRKGANMMGMDQDDIVLAPWTTIKYRVSGSSLTNANQSAAPTASSVRTTVNTLSNLYPAATALYPRRPPIASGRHAAARPLRQRRPDPRQGRLRPSRFPQAIDEITALLRERHRIRPGQRRRLQHPRHDRDDQDDVLDVGS